VLAIVVPIFCVLGSVAFYRRTRQHRAMLSPSELLSTSSVIRKVIFEFVSNLAGAADPLWRLRLEIEEVRSGQSAREEVRSRKWKLEVWHAKAGRGNLLATHKATFCSNLIGGYRKTEIFRKGACSHKCRSDTLRQQRILLEFYRHYYNHTAILDRLLEKVSAYVAMAYVMARSGSHNTKKTFFIL
jgi:hypothetical protein